MLHIGVKYAIAFPVGAARRTCARREKDIDHSDAQTVVSAHRISAPWHSAAPARILVVVQLLHSSVYLLAVHWAAHQGTTIDACLCMCSCAHLRCVCVRALTGAFCSPYTLLSAARAHSFLQPVHAAFCSPYILLSAACAHSSLQSMHIPFCFDQTVTDLCTGLPKGSIGRDKTVLRTHISGRADCWSDVKILRIRGLPKCGPNPGAL